VSRYSKVIPGIWDDDKVPALSKPKPNAQTLWFYLITGPHITGIPGLWRLSPGTIAEHLGWPPSSVHRFLMEIEAKGLARFDFRARVVFIPGRFKHDEPTSPNVIKHWRSRFDEVPGTYLKGLWLEKAKDYLKDFNKAYTEAFDQAFAKVLREVFRNPEPEPEPEPFPKPLPSTATRTTASTSTSAGAATDPQPVAQPSGAALQPTDAGKDTHSADRGKPKGNGKSKPQAAHGFSTAAEAAKGIKPERQEPRVPQDRLDWREQTAKLKAESEAAWKAWDLAWIQRTRDHPGADVTDQRIIAAVNAMGGWGAISKTAVGPALWELRQKFLEAYIAAQASQGARA